MDLKQLRYFAMVAEELSFVRAAHRLHMSQPPLSQQIKALEEELGVALLFRTKREVKLTDAGRVFLRDSRELLERAQAMGHRARQAAGGEQATLRVGMATSALFHVLPRFLAQMRTCFPQMSVAVTDMNSDEQVRSLAVDKLDLGFIHSRQDVRGLERMTLVVDGFAMVLPAAHPLAQRPDLLLRDLQSEAMVAFSREHAPALFDALIASCQQEGFSPRIAHVARHPASLLQMVRLGLGVSIVPRAYAADAQPGLVFRQLAPMAGQLRIEAIWRGENTGPGLAKVIAGVLQAFMHDVPDEAAVSGPGACSGVEQGT